MSLPRAVVPGRAYMITRRCSERRFFLRPSEEGNNAFIYCLAVAAEKYGIQVMFTTTMSNHHHTGVVDVHGNLPDFLAYFHKLVAKHQNALHGRWEAMWSSSQTSAVELIGPEDIFRKMLYALVNPVAGQAVEKVLDWPGVTSLTAIAGDVPLTATRPKKFFRPDGEMPEHVKMHLHLPAALVAGSRPEFVKRLQEGIQAAEATAARERLATGRAVVGRSVILRQHWNDSPTTKEPRRELSPRVACIDMWRRIESLARNKVWLSSYREARDKFVAGAQACFPAGTFWLRRFAGVSCEPFPAT